MDFSRVPVSLDLLQAPAVFVQKVPPPSANSNAPAEPHSEDDFDELFEFPEDAGSCLDEPSLGEAEDEPLSDDIFDLGSLRAEEEPLALDDPEATELDDGISLDDPIGESVESEGEFTFDIGTLLHDSLDSVLDTPEEPELDPSIFGLGLDLETPGATEDSSEDLGLQDDFSLIDDHPPAETGSNLEAAIDFGSFDYLEADASITSADLPWQSQPLEQRVEPCSSVIALSNSAVSGSTDLLWFEGEVLAKRQPLMGQRISSLVLAGDGFRVAICATITGHLGRSRAETEKPEWNRAWRDVLGAKADDPLRLRLIQPTQRLPEHVLSISSRGQLLVSPDAGLGWQAIEAPGPVLAAAQTEQGLLLLAEHRGKLGLWRSAASGSRPELAVALHDQWAELIGAKPVELVVSQDQLLVYQPMHGVFVLQGAAPPRPISGCSGVTAVTAGLIDGQAAAFVATYSESQDRSELYLVELASVQVQRIASIERDPNLSPSEATESARVLALSYDETAERLWAAGPFGLMRWSAQRR